MKKSKILKGILAVFIALAALLTGGTMTLFEYGDNINNQLHIATSRIVTDEDAEPVDTAYYKSDYADSNLLAKSADELTSEEKATVSAALAKLTAEEDQFVEYEMANSAVLLRNENNALPLSSSERKVNLFGVTSRQPLYSCASGGGKNDDTRAVNFIDAFKAKGFTVNQTLYDAYPDPAMKQSFGGMMADRADDEPDPAMFTAEIDQSVRETGGAAVIFLAREGGEGEDIQHFVTEADGTVRSGLALSNNEKAMLAKVQQYKNEGAVSKIIVVHNSPYAMELGWFDEYGVDAAVHIGTIGLKGSLGLVDILTGEVNPSGHLVDTFAENSLSHASVQTWYDQSFTNSSVEGRTAFINGIQVANSGSQKYMVLLEGIYTGYKYYETRYEDTVLNRYNANGTKGSTSGAWNYANEIVYPFGYGLSYTSFEQKLDNVTGFDTETITVTATVTNNGNVSGRSVVQVYAQTPYGDYEIQNKVEKSAVTLVGFGKTGELKPGESETLTIPVERYLLASWDSNSNSKEGGYILSAGDTYIAIGENAHDALNNVLAAKGASGMTDEQGKAVSGDSAKTKKYTYAFDDISYRYSKITGERVENRFEDTDINYWLPGSVTYMTRSDWNTYPDSVPVLTASDEMVKLLTYSYTRPEGAEGVNESEFGIDAGLKLVDMRNVEWEDEQTWNAFLHQLTLDELGVSIADRFGNAGVESIAKPASINDDGPDGWNQKYVINGAQSTCYIGEAIAACSFDTEMIETRANYMAEDAMFCNLSQGWAPGGNLHRTPFSGRNHEYFSEDANVNYLYLGKEVAVMINKGISVGGKHFAGNDVELNRSNACMFQTEQTWRQNSLRGFESSFTEGGATSTMNCKGAIGLRNISEDYASQVEVLRGEWGFKGVVIADAGSGRGPEGIVCGTDMWCLRGQTYANSILTWIRENNDGNMLKAVLEANKRYYYAFSRSIQSNGLASNTHIEKITPWWQTAIIAVDSVVGIAVIALATLYILSLRKERKE